LYNKPATCGTSGGISYRNPTLKKKVDDYDDDDYDDEV
jgi:hypothetical protein